MSKKQSALALHLIHYYLIDLVRLYRDHIRIEEEFRVKEAESLLEHLYNPVTPYYRSRREHADPEAFVLRVKWLYEALLPVLYIIESESAYRPFGDIIKWLKDKAADIKALNSYCWCKGCRIAREEDVKDNPDKYCHIPPAYCLTNTTYSPAGIFRSSTAPRGEEPEACVEWSDPVKEYREWRERLVSAVPGRDNYGEGCIDDIISKEAKLASLWPEKFDAAQSFEVKRGYLLDKYGPQHKALIEAYNAARLGGLEASEVSAAAYAVHRAYCDELILLVRENGKGFIKGE